MTWEELKVTARASGGQIYEKEIKLQKAQVTYTVFYREAEGDVGLDRVPFLFLHGLPFTSATWLNLGTLHVTSFLGHRTVAVDSPGFGKTRGQGLTAKAQFLETFIGALGLGHPILMSPSMSGSFSFPFIFEIFTHTPIGYIPIAPVKVNDYTDYKYRVVTIPTYSIVGDRDKTLGAPATAKFQLMPNAEIHILQDAGHPCYIDQPEEFHRIMYAFAEKIENNMTEGIMKPWRP